MLLIHDLSAQSKIKILYNNSIIFSLLFGIVFGLFTEIIQMIEILRRNGNIYDFIADIIGCMLGISLYLWVFKKKLKNVNK